MTPRLIAPALIFLAAACGGTEPSADCHTAPDAVLTAIAEGRQDGTGLAPIRGAAYKSPDHVKIYLIAMTFTAHGVDEQTGVWATNSLTAGKGMILSVDGMAKQFTVWPDASETQAEISSADDIVSTAKGCL